MRESSFELIRLLAMWMIVVYHQYLHHIQTAFDTPFNKAIWIPLHIGVPLFLFISGYWGIKVSGKSFFRLWGMLALYSIPMLLIYRYLTGMGGVKSIVFFISNSDFWFLRTYICLYLISPLINSYLVTSSKSQYLFILIALGIISVYIGSLTDVDSSLKIGKNLTNFMFCYVVGNAVRRYEKMWRRIPVWQLISVFILYNAFVVAFYCILEGKGLAAKIYSYVFCYNSPGLIFSALLFFMIVLHWQFKSKVINWLASSALAIYLIHESRLVETYILGPISLSIRTNLGGDLLSLPAIGLFAIGICVICIFVDKLLAPIWKWFGHIGECSERKIKTYLLPYNNKGVL